MDLTKLLNELHLERQRLTEMIGTLESLALSRPSKPWRPLDRRKSGAAAKEPRPEQAGSE